MTRTVSTEAAEAGCIVRFRLKSRFYGPLRKDDKNSKKVIKKWIFDLIFGIIETVDKREKFYTYGGSYERNK